jgi:PleD family two-component response regulator
MTQGRILVVEDDKDTAEMLQIYFNGHGYSVEVALRGTDAFSATKGYLPDLIILDIMLPGMDGYAVCRELRTMTRTSHIPIIFLTQKDERSDRIAGLELGADDYVTKPFDIEELGLRVKNAILSHQRMNMTDPRTGLPAARLIEDQLRELMRADSWTYAEVAIQNMQPFLDSYGFVAGDEVLRYTALLLNETIDESGTADDFIGHAGGQIFVLITYADEAEALLATIRQRFDQQIRTHYSFIDSEQGGILRPDGSIAPMMSLAIGAVSSEMRDFVDIREITEAAAESRRFDQAPATR